MAMDVDEDEDGTQRTKTVSDYGVEVDFNELDQDERDVIHLNLSCVRKSHRPHRMVARNAVPNTKPQ
jgi:hypothetical protein